VKYRGSNSVPSAVSLGMSQIPQHRELSESRYCI